MDDLKSKSISELTDSELSRFNNRLDMELEVERLLLRIKSNNGERPDGITGRITVDTKTPINQLYHSELKNKSISEMSMTELGQLLTRLQLELRVQDKILDLKRNSDTDDYDWENRPSADVTTPINQLYHYGVLGMKWGVRKKKESTGRKRTSSSKSKAAKSEEEKPKSEDYQESRVLKSKAYSGLNNAELKRLNERLNLEKQYKDLTKADQQKGKNFLSDSVASGLKQTASTVVAASSLYAVKKLIEKSMGSAAAAEMFPKKK